MGKKRYPLRQVPSSCDGCGACCHMAINITREDAQRLGPELTEEEGGGFFMQRIPICQDADVYRCIALDPATHRCTIYDRRPETCRLFQRGSDWCELMIGNQHHPGHTLDGIRIMINE
jgi:Fe-S-cluster containining protein